jgi:hypothetical protein
MSNHEDWAVEYEKLMSNPPAPGAILKAYGDSMARLNIELVADKPPFVYGLAFVPCIVGKPLGWFLQAIDSEGAHGWKCILLPKAREEAIRKLGLKTKVVPVKSLRVIRMSNSKNSLLCEINEYA